MKIIQIICKQKQSFFDNFFAKKLTNRYWQIFTAIDYILTPSVIQFLVFNDKNRNSKRNEHQFRSKNPVFDDYLNVLAQFQFADRNFRRNTHAESDPFDFYVLFNVHLNFKRLRNVVLKAVDYGGLKTMVF